MAFQASTVGNSILRGNTHGVIPFGSRWFPVGPRGELSQNLGRSNQRRSNRQRERRVPGVSLRREYALNAQYRQVLRRRVPENGAEHSNVKGTAITHPHHGLGVDLICDTHARSKILKGVLYVSVEPYAIFSGDQHLAGVQVYPAPLVFSCDGLRVVDFPAKTKG